MIDLKPCPFCVSNMVDAATYAVNRPVSVVRRLTPLECTRLQGFPDGWVDIGDWVDTKGKKHKDADSPKYKALGNSIALPFWRWMFRRMAEYLPEKAALGSLFDGIGGFPKCWEDVHGAGTALWASEIEEFPIAVTKTRFPGMEHLGDITKLNGAELKPVHAVAGGSPCQDLSMAGKRKGLEGERSGLFMDQIRVVKEMRESSEQSGADDLVWPRYMVWENVPGALSCNGGRDFAAVLEETIRIADPEAPGIDVPAKGWPNWGGYRDVDGRWSVAWRVHDAQFWGVPQRRRRISLVADFGGGTANEILFERKSVSGDPAEGFRSWQRAAGSFTPCPGATGYDGYNGSLTEEVSSTLGVNCGMSTGRNGILLKDQGGNRMDVTEGVTCTLRAEAHHPPCVLEEAVAVENHQMDGRVKLEENGKVQTLSERMGTGGNNVPHVLKIRSGCEGGGKGPLIQTDKSATLSCNNDQTLFEPCSWDGGQVSPTLTKQNAGGNQRMPDKDNFNCVLQPFGISSKDSNAMKSSNPHSGIYKADVDRTLDLNGGSPACNQGGVMVVYEEKEDNNAAD